MWSKSLLATFPPVFHPGVSRWLIEKYWHVGKGFCLYYSFCGVKMLIVIGKVHLQNWSAGPDDIRKTSLAITVLAYILKLLTCRIIWKKTKDIFTLGIVSWIWLDPSRWNQPWNNITCRLFYTANIMSADALATLEARASTSVVLIPKAGIFRLEHQKSYYTTVLTMK